MDEQTQPTKEIIQLHSAGALPGIPGELGAGRYEIDYAARTATPVDENGQPIAAEPAPEQTPASPQAEPEQTPATPQEETQQASPEEPPTEAQPVPAEEAQA